MSKRLNFASPSRKQVNIDTFINSNKRRNNQSSPFKNNKQSYKHRRGSVNTTQILTKDSSTNFFAALATDIEEEHLDETTELTNDANSEETEKTSNNNKWEECLTVIEEYNQDH
jgi:hypothetical protein